MEAYSTGAAKWRGGGGVAITLPEFFFFLGGGWGFNPYPTISNQGRPQDLGGGATGACPEIGKGGGPKI